jgi:hypothetical protein
MSDREGDLILNGGKPAEIGESMNGTRKEQKACPIFRFIGSDHQFSP